MQESLSFDNSSLHGPLIFIRHFTSMRVDTVCETTVCYCYAGNSHFKAYNKDQVKYDIDYTGNGKKDKRLVVSPIALSIALPKLYKKHGRHTEKIDFKIQRDRPMTFLRAISTNRDC